MYQTLISGPDIISAGNAGWFAAQSRQMNVDRHSLQ